MPEPDADDATTLVLLQIGGRLREIRQRAGLTQEQLSGVTGIDYKRIQRIEGGAVNVTVRTLVRLAVGIECQVSDFFGTGGGS